MMHLDTWASFTLTKVGFFFFQIFSLPLIYIRGACLPDVINMSCCHLQQKHNFHQSLFWIYICWLDPPLTLKRRWSGWVLEHVFAPIQPSVGEAVWGVCKEVLVPRWRCTWWCSRDAGKMKQVCLLRVDIHASTETGLINHRRQKAPSGLAQYWLASLSGDHILMVCVAPVTL